MAIEKLGVVGCGLMGSGIAQTAAQAGLQVTVREVSKELIDKGLANIDKSLARLVQRGTLSAADRDAARKRLRPTTKLEDLAGCDLIIEAITEQLEPKKELFRALDGFCPPQTIYASNTSSLSITEMAVATQRPERFVGLHFFNLCPS
jgi:3-hydroxybutyryl-CoA dehydrogenase